ncbi:hypothetical protein Nepgr_000384 [Nepenthes gracilis]|uniref:Uncharacterized protein n=1 Tax=Nepenthes gracilis TaxID=150966 RepID=A0AAD3P1R0_NEPGR|nr:hypothetical protein Nepgr_000384 [Nepenthes gracilis]
MEGVALSFDHENKENIPPFSSKQSNAVHYPSKSLKCRTREPLRDITHLFISSPRSVSLFPFTRFELESSCRKRKAIGGSGTKHSANCKSLRNHFR